MVFATVLGLVGPSYSEDLDENDPVVRELLEAHGVRIATWPQFCDGEVGAAEVQGLVVCAHAPVDGALLDRFPNLKVVSNYGVGVDHIDRGACRSRGIPVGNTPDVLSDATCDMAWALMMACARRVVEGDALARSEAWVKYDNMVLLGKDVTGATLGIVGMGRIGTEVARRAAGFRMKIMYCNRTRRPAEEEAALSAEFATKDRLLSEADFVVLLCPMSAETRHFIDAAALGRMKRDAVLVNVARGGVVDTDALLRALTEGTIGGAGLDVTDPEPLPRDHPMLRLRNVVMAPHRGSATAQTRRAMAVLAANNLFAGLEGRELETCCN